LRLPLVKNKLFFGAAALYNKRNGYYENDFNKNSFDQQHALTVNYFLKWNAGTRLSFTLNAKHNNNRNLGAFTLVNGVDEALKNPFHLNQDAVAKMIDNTLNISLIASYTGKGFDFSSQTTFQRNQRFYDKPLDADFSPIDGITIINNYGHDWNKSGVWTQEFKFNSPSVSTGKLKWTAGSYLFSQNNPTKQAVHFGKDAAWVGAPDINFSLISTTKAKSRGAAFFGQVTYSITDKMKIIAGLRYDFEKKKYNILGEYQKDPNPVPLFETRPDTSASINFNALSPRLGFTYNLGLQSDVFVTYSRGFRTGGLTPLSSDPSQPPLFPFKPEHSNNIEAGIKNNLLKNKLQINLTLFMTNINDAQIPTLLLPDAVTVTKNAGKLTSKGIELELSSTPFKGLRIDYNFGYTNAVYKNLKLSQNGSAVNLDGKKQIFTPGATSMLVLQYGYVLNAKQQLKLVTRFEWMTLGKQYFDLTNMINQKEYSLINTHIGISFKKTSLMFWARNLSDKKYIAYAYDFGAVHLGDPKTIGITLSSVL
jgi:iron complex outermembrane receptor protein